MDYPLQDLQLIKDSCASDELLAPHCILRWTKIVPPKHTYINTTLRKIYKKTHYVHYLSNKHVNMFCFGTKYLPKQLFKKCREIVQMERFV